MGVFRGKRVQGGDYFDDIQGDYGDHGVFNGMGIADYDSVREKVTDEGLKVLLNCRSCNKRAEMTIGWEEMYVISQNRPGQRLVLPADWQYSQNNGTCFTQQRCSKCGEPGFAVHVTPQEATQRIQQGVQAGFVTKQDANEWARKVAAYRGAR